MINSKNEESKYTKSKNRTLKVLENIGFTIFMVVMSILIFITAQSRITGKEPALLGHRIYIVDSGSMSPAIEVDSMIIVKEIKGKEIVKGDIITYYGHNQGARITHRVAEVESNGKTFITKGDANEIRDPLPLDANKLIGKVIFVIPLIGKVFRLLTTRLGLGLIISLGIAWIVLPRLFSEKIEK